MLKPSFLGFACSLNRWTIVFSGRSWISPRWGCQPLGGGGCHHTILPYFPKNCMKLKEFGPRVGWHASKMLLCRSDCCWILDAFEWIKHRCTYVHSRIYSYVVEPGEHSSTCCTSGWWSWNEHDIWNLHWFIYKCMNRHEKSWDNSQMSLNTKGDNCS